MKVIKLLLLVAALFTAPVLFAQDKAQVTEITKPEEVIQESKPFIGKWDSVICSDQPTGFRFGIALKDNADKSVSPVLTAIDVQGDPRTAPVIFKTLSFAHVIYPDGVKFIGLAATNGAVLIRVRPSFSNARRAIVTNLDFVLTDENGEDTIGFAIKEGDDSKSQWDYVKTLSMVCPPPDDENAQPRPQQAAFPVSVRDETDQEIEAARQEFNRFAEEHKIEWAITGREKVGAPWFVRYYIFPENSDKPLTWEEEDYPRLLDAVVAIERDFLTHPEGYSGKYDGGQRA
jgi:hypothetical protein